MIIFGRRGYEKEIGNTNIVQQCPHCNNTVTYKGIEYGTKFSLFFVPLFPISKERMIVCPICKHGYKVNKEEMEKYIVE